MAACGVLLMPMTYCDAWVYNSTATRIPSQPYAGACSHNVITAHLCMNIFCAKPLRKYTGQCMTNVTAHGQERATRCPRCASEKAAKLDQKLGQLEPFTAVFPQECMGQLGSFRPT